MGAFKLEVGKRYITRYGGIVTVVREEDGKFYTNDIEQVSFPYYENGRIALSDELPIDIVEEYTQPVTVQQMIAEHSVNPKLRAWAEANKDNASDDSSPYWYHDEPGFRDFNREMFAPGQHEQFPEGCVGIRTDGDFWAVAALPWEFKDLRLQEIVCTLWPDVGVNGKYTLGWDRGPAAEYTILSTCQEVSEEMKTIKRQIEIFENRFKHLYLLAEEAATPIELDRIREDIAGGRTLRFKKRPEKMRNKAAEKNTE